MEQKITFFPTAPEKMVKNKKYFGFFLVSYISIQKKKCTSEQFLQGRPTMGVSNSTPMMMVSYQTTNTMQEYF